MPQIYAKWGVMNSRSASIKFAGQKLDYYNLMLSLISNDIPFSRNINHEIKNALKSQYVIINRSSEKIRKMSATLSKAANLYKSTEERLESEIISYGNNFEITEKNGFNIMGKDEGTSGFFDRTVHQFDVVERDDVLEVIGEFGIVGNIISAVGSLITGTVPAKNSLECLKYLSGAVDDIAESAGDVTSNWKNYFGFNSKDTMGFLDSLKNQVDELKFGKSKTDSQNISVSAKWAGYIATGLLEAYDNFYENPEGNSTGRKIAETIGETAVTIGTGALVTAGVTAGLAALGVVSAPVVVTGLITVGVCWAVDSVCEYMTGKNLAEFVSDKVLDAGTEFVNTVKESGKAIGNAAKSAGEAVGKAAKTVTDKIGGWWQKAFG